MRDQVLGPDAAELDDAVSDLHKHILCDSETYNRIRRRGSPFRGLQDDPTQIMLLNMRASRILLSAAVRATSDSLISPRAAKLRAHLRQLRAPRTARLQRRRASSPQG